MGAFDNYNVLTRYPCVISAYESGLTSPFIKVKKIILTVEAEYKAEHGKTILNITDKNNISSEIEFRLTNQKPVKQKVKEENVVKFKANTSPDTIKSLLTKNILDLDTGITWDNIDWEDSDAVSKTLASVIHFLENEPK
jgi:hypothetical protein